MKSLKILVLAAGLASMNWAPAQAAMLDDILSKDKNPFVLFVYNASEACPVDFIGLGKDAGEALGLIAPPAARQSARPGSFADHVQGLTAESKAGQGRLQRVLNRFCLYSKLFGDGSCER